MNAIIGSCYVALGILTGLAVFVLLVRESAGRARNESRRLSFPEIFADMLPDVLVALMAGVVTAMLWPCAAAALATVAVLWASQGRRRK